MLSTNFWDSPRRVTDEALITETMVWPNFFLMNVFFALQGSKPFIIISHVNFLYHERGPLQKMMLYNRKLDLVNDKVYTKLG